MPPLKAGGKHAAMSAPLTLRDRCQGEACRLRSVLPELGRDKPEGAQDRCHRRRLEPRRARRALPIPKVKPGSTTAQTLAAGKVVAKENGAMDFIANATGAIYAQSWTPAVQKLFAGADPPEDVLKTVQADYKKQVASGG